MPSSYHIDSKNTVFRLLQITDTHLFKDKNNELLGINTFNSYLAVLNNIIESGYNYQAVIASGDIVQDNTRQAYTHFAEEAYQLNAPVFWLPGNHDFLPFMVKHLSEHNIQKNKYITIGDKWQIILLDSQEFGVPHGRLDDYQLQWLDKILSETPERYSLIVLHHHILPTHSAWLDQHNLRNVNELFAILEKHKNIKGIAHGHVHQASDNTYRGIPIYSTPSTCIQFKPDSTYFALSDLQPGWRELNLHDNGEITSHVHRVAEGSFIPNYGSSGY